MKTCSRIVLTLLVLVAGMSEVKAHDEYSRVIKKEYAVNPDAQLVIVNQYGKIKCTNWDKPAISVEVILTAEASSEEAAQKILDRITIAMTGSPSLVDLRSTIEKGGSQGHSKFNINFNVFLPASINVDLTNKFGDISMDVINGKGKISLSYGNLEINKLENSDNLLDIKFSKVNVKSIKGAVVLLKYSELEMEYAGSLRVDSKYSDITGNNVISLNINFEGGKLEIEKASAVEGHSKFGDLSFSRIETSLQLDIQYGNCDVEEMPATFSTIRIDNKYADVSIGIPKDASYTLEADLKFCDLDFPSGNATFTQKIKTNTSKSYRAVIGKESAQAAKITINSEFGNISLE
jgi:hypothetical protein